MYIKHELFKHEFERLETFEGEYLSLLDPKQRYFKNVQTTNSENKKELYQYLNTFATNPLPEHHLEKFVYFSFVSNKAEIKIMTDFFGHTGRSDSNKYINDDSFYSSRQFKNFMSRNGFMRKFLFKLPKLINAFIESGNGNFFGTLMNWLFEKYKKSILKSDSNSRSYYFESEKKIEISKDLMDTIKALKNKNDKKVEAKGFGEMEDKRMVGNYKIDVESYKDRVIENATFFNHLESIVFNLQSNNLKVNLDYGVIKHAIEVLEADSFTK